MSSLADGEWHRLHPATPLLRGGLVFLAVLGWVLFNLRDFLLESFLGDLIGLQEGFPADPGQLWLLDNVGIAALAVAALLVVILGAGWLSWRMHAFRVTDELVEVRSGVIWRRHRRGRLDRIQGVNVVRALLPRLVGAARLDIQVAGQDANIRLAYLASANADDLRAVILAKASESRRIAAAEGASGSNPVPESESPSGGVVQRRIGEFLAPELDQPLAEPESIVHMHAGRVAASIGLGLVLPVLFIAAILAGFIAWTGQYLGLLIALPIAIAVAGVSVRRFTRSLRYSIAATPDGIRVGFGVLSTTNETLPPGRIHAIEIAQPLLWRPFGWWYVRVNRASISLRDGAAGQANTVILPVGTAEDVRRVLDLLLSGWAEPEAFTVSPSRARWFRWFSRRRNGFAVDDRAVVLRKGAIWRSLVVVPFARVQAVAIVDGPLYRVARLARVEVHTVPGVVRATIGALDRGDAEGLWSEVGARTLEAMA